MFIVMLIYNLMFFMQQIGYENLNLTSKTILVDKFAKKVNHKLETGNCYLF